MANGVNKQDLSDSRDTQESAGTDIVVAPAYLLTQRALDYVHNHLSSPLDGATVAAALGVSRKTLCKHFKNDTGETFARFVMRKRIDCACHLLETSDLIIAQIAYQTGFSSQSHLNTAFKRTIGITPREWRLRAQRGHTET